MADQFEVRAGSVVLRGEVTGNGPDVVCAHGLTATRRYVLQGSSALPRAGFRVSAYDARGHGESDASPPEADYSYDLLADDLGVILAERAPESVTLVGHSMGAHSIARLALDGTDAIRAIVFIGPAWRGEEAGEGKLSHWDALADGLERGGPEGFAEALDAQGINPEWRDTILRISRDRLAQHRHPDAVARALREVPRSQPFASLDDLKTIDVPCLVVGSHDTADPGHPLAVAQEWADRLPRASLVTEEAGESPLAWQGGRLSRTIAEFLADLGD